MRSDASRVSVVATRLRHLNRLGRPNRVERSWSALLLDPHQMAIWPPRFIWAADMNGQATRAWMKLECYPDGQIVKLPKRSSPGWDRPDIPAVHPGHDGLPGQVRRSRGANQGDRCAPAARAAAADCLREAKICRMDRSEVELHTDIRGELVGIPAFIRFPPAENRTCSDH